MTSSTLFAILLTSGLFAQAPPTLAQQPNQNFSGNSHLTFDVREIKVDDFGWRQSIYGKARRLDWQAGATVWAIDDAAVTDLMEYLQGNNGSNLIQAPRANAAAGQATRTFTGSMVSFVIDMERQANGPLNESSAISFNPVMEEVRDGLDLTLSATPDATGVSLGINLNDQQVQEVHTASFTEDIYNKALPSRRFKLLRLKDADKPVINSVSGTIQIPDIKTMHVEGVWSITPYEHLLVSLGTETTEERKAGVFDHEKVWERLVLISVRPHAGGLGQPVPAASSIPQPRIPNPSIQPR